MSAGSDRASAFMSIWSAEPAVLISTQQPATGLSRAGRLSNPGSRRMHALLMKSSYGCLSSKIMATLLAVAPFMLPGVSQESKSRTQFLATKGECMNF